MPGMQPSPTHFYLFVYGELFHEYNKQITMLTNISNRHESHEIDISFLPAYCQTNHHVLAVWDGDTRYVFHVTDCINDWFFWSERFYQYFVITSGRKGTNVSFLQFDSTTKSFLSNGTK